MRTTDARVGDSEDREGEDCDVFVEIDQQHSLIWVGGKRVERENQGRLLDFKLKPLGGTIS